MIGAAAPFTMIREIKIIPDPILRQKAHRVRTQSQQYLNELKKDLIDTLEANSGAGLAAPQIGVSLRVIAFIDDERNSVVLINPEITFVDLETEKSTEGCLSIPGFLGEVERSTLIKVQHQIGNKWFKKLYLGFTARVVQHEIDHLDGILIVDKISDISKKPEYGPTI